MRILHSITFKIIFPAVSMLLLSVLIVSSISFLVARTSLREKAFDQLNAVRQIKENQIVSFFNDRKADIEVYAFNTAVIMATERFVKAFEEGGLEGEEWKKWDSAHGPKFKLYIEKLLYYDLFIISPEGDIVFTAAKEGDLGLNIDDVKIRNSGIAEAFRRGKDGLHLTDFAWYDISNEPASFISAPVHTKDGLAGVLVYQISLKAIDSIMHERSGMGKTGETYLVGSDNRMRSDSYLDSENRSVKASFSGSVEKNGVDTEATKSGLAGKTSSDIIIDYNGNRVLSSWAPFEVGDTSWVIIAEIDEAEIEKPVIWMRNIIIIAALLSLVLASFILFAVVNASLLNPISKSIEFAKVISTGDFRKRLDTRQKGEIGELVSSLNTMSSDLEKTIYQVMISAQNLVQAVNEISLGNENLSQRTTEQASSLEEVASTIEETSATVNQNAENSKASNILAAETADLAESGGSTMKEAVEAINEINKSSKKIEEITSVIDEIAFQTNLLALNAAVEAARAGEAGRGFAVVASEVRNLAQRSGTAAKEINMLIKETIEKVENGTTLANNSGAILKEIIESIKRVRNNISEIAMASQEQKQGTDQINVAVGELDHMTQQNAGLVEETASASEEMANQAQELLALIEKFSITTDDSSSVRSMDYERLEPKKSIPKAASKVLEQQRGGEDRADDTSLSDDSREIERILAREGFQEF